MQFVIRSSASILPAVAPRKRAEIEEIAERLIKRFYPDCLTTPQPLPVNDFLEFDLPNAFGVRIGVSDDFPVGVEGVTDPHNIDGEAELTLPGWVYQRLQAHDPRARFTAIHEGGHGVLHVPQLRSALISGGAPKLYRREELQLFRNPEWQANVFAGAFLMPTPAVLAVVKRWGVDPDRLASTFTVSRSAAETRLYYMGRVRLL